MFSPDVISLRQFYASHLGGVVQGFIAEAIQRIWPGVHGDVMLAVGYALPYVEPYLAGAAPLMIAMPAEQGASSWPHDKPNLVLLSHDSELPFQQNAINRVLLIHSVEHSEQLNGMMQEVWRVLVPGGRVLIVVPNRLSFWSGSSKSPFGFGRPFSLSQLRTLLANHQLTITRTSSALFSPPIRARFWQKPAYYMERVGRFFGGLLGGVILIEAEKQLYASIKQPVTHRKRYGLLSPAPKPVVQRKDS